MARSKRHPIKKFFIKGIVFFSIGYLSLFLTYNYLITGHDDEKYLIRKFLKNKKTIEAIAIGTSHAWAINFKALGLDGIGLGAGGRDLQECKYILEFLISQPGNNIKTVFISYSYFSLYQDHSAANGGITDTRVFMYNNIPSWKVIPGDYKNFIVGKFFPFIQSDHWKSILIRQIRKLKRNKIEEKGEKRAPGTNIPKKEIPLKNIKARVAEQHRIHENAQSRNRSRVKQHSLNLLNEITNFLKGKGIEVIFFTPPYYYKYTELYKNEYIDEMKRAMNQLVESDGVEYLDYSTDRDIAYNADLFQDPDHINLEATRILAKKILKDLQR